MADTESDQLIREIETRHRRHLAIDKIHVTGAFFDNAAAQLGARVEGDTFWIFTQFGRVAVVRTP